MRSKLLLGGLLASVVVLPVCSTGTRAYHTSGSCRQRNDTSGSASSHTGSCPGTGCYSGPGRYAGSEGADDHHNPDGNDWSMAGF